MKYSFNTIMFSPSFSLFNVISISLCWLFLPTMMAWSPLYGPAILLAIMIFGISIDSIITLIYNQRKVKRLEQELAGLNSEECAKN
jgi:hypothetical protein